MSNQTLNLTPELYDYVTKNGIREPDILIRLREETALRSESRFQISPEQGQFMAMLAQLIQAKNYLEIGVYTGYSTLAVGLVLPEDGHIVACDVSEEWARVAQQYWQQAKIDKKISLKIAPAEETLNDLLKQRPKPVFDMVFIDADKENYDIYYECCLQLLRPGGLMLIDNVLWSGAVADERQQDEETVALRNLNKKVIVDDRVDALILPLSDGITLAIKR